MNGREVACSSPRASVGLGPLARKPSSAGTPADVTVAWPWRVTTGLAGLGLAGGLGLEGEVEELRWFGQVKGVQHGLLAVRAVP